MLKRLGQVAAIGIVLGAGVYFSTIVGGSSSAAAGGVGLQLGEQPSAVNAAGFSSKVLSAPGLDAGGNVNVNGTITVSESGGAGTVLFGTAGELQYNPSAIHGGFILFGNSWDFGNLEAFGEGGINISGGAQFDSITVGGGNLIKGLNWNTCTLSSGSCNMTMSISDGTTHCVCSSDETTSTAAGCNCKADGGAISVSCLAATTGVASAWCFK